MIDLIYEKISQSNILNINNAYSQLNYYQYIHGFYGESSELETSRTSGQKDGLIT